MGARALLCLGIICCGLSVSCISEDVEGGGPDKIRVGDVLPEFSVRMDDGRLVDTEALEGKPSVILFVNTACGDCQKELPRVQRVYEQYGADGRVNFVAVSREEGAASVRGYWAANGLTLPFSAQTDRTVYHLFASSAIPRIYVSDRSLVVQAVYTDNPLATVEDLSYALEAALQEGEN